MGYHAINEGSSITVYRIAGCPSDEIIGTLYNGEVFTVIGEHQGYCILRSLTDIDAFQSGRFAEQNGRSKTLKYQLNLAVESLLYSAL